MRLSRSARRLVRALADKAGRPPVVEAFGARPWASITFNGTRIGLTLNFDGPGAEAAIGALGRDLDHAEFELGEELLVDIALERQTAPGRVRIEALVIERD